MNSKVSLGVGLLVGLLCGYAIRGSAPKNSSVGAEPSHVTTPQPRAAGDEVFVSLPLESERTSVELPEPKEAEAPLPVAKEEKEPPKRRGSIELEPPDFYLLSKESNPGGKQPEPNELAQLKNLLEHEKVPVFFAEQKVKSILDDCAMQKLMDGSYEDLPAGTSPSKFTDMRAGVYNVSIHVNPDHYPGKHGGMIHIETGEFGQLDGARDDGLAVIATSEMKIKQLISYW
jgi:hypothetical protein